MPAPAAPTDPAEADPRPWPPGAPASDAWREAGEGWGRRLDAQRLARLRPGSFDLATLNAIALDDDNICHVLAEIGFATIEAELPLTNTRKARALHPCLRCGAAWWPDPFGRVLIASGEGVGHVAVDTGSGAWRALPLGGARGLDVIELVARRLDVPARQAAVKLARMCGLAAVPEVAR